MDLSELHAIIEDFFDKTQNYHIPITVHTGGDNWEEIVEITYCQGCNQYHVISERVSGINSGEGQ